MRVRITDRLTGSIDGIQLERFTVGYVYDVGPTLACYLMAVGAAEPVLDETPVQIWPREKLMFASEAGSDSIPVGWPHVVRFPRDHAHDRPRRPRKGKKTG